MSLNLREFLADLGYTDLRVVRGKVCGLARFDLVAGLVVGLDISGSEAAYTYENEIEARAALTAWDGESHPPGPWIRVMGLSKGCMVDMRNPAFDPPVFGRAEVEAP